MSTVKIAETGWADFVLDHLRAALKAAESTASDLAKMRMCDGAGCGRTFDMTDPRSRALTEAKIEYHLCPGCELQARLADAEMSLGIWDPSRSSEYWLRYSDHPLKHAETTS